MANHGCRQRKWPPTTPHEALRSVPMGWMDGQQPPKQAGIIFWSCWGCVWPSKHSDVVAIHHCRNKRALWGPCAPSTPPKNYIRLLGGLSSIHLWCRHGAEGIMWGARGPFLPATAMAVAVVTPVLFGAKATEKCNKNTKTSCLLEIILFIIISCKIYCNSYIANCSMARAQVVAWLEPEPLWSMDPGILGINGKLLSLQELLTDYIEA